MTKYDVKLGDVFWVPFGDSLGYVIAGEDGFISVKRGIIRGTRLNIYSGVAYLFNLLDTVPRELIDDQLPYRDRMNLSNGDISIEWKGVDK